MEEYKNHIELHFLPIETPEDGADTVVVCVPESGELPDSAQRLGAETADFLRVVLEGEESFSGKRGQTVCLRLPMAAARARRIVLFGVGNPESATFSQAQDSGGKLLQALAENGAKHACIRGDDLGEIFLSGLMSGVILRSYRFERYKTQAPDAETQKSGEDSRPACPPARITVHAQDPGALQGAYETETRSVCAGVFWARDLTNEPPNILYPESFAQNICDHLAPLGVEIESLDEKDMERLGMGAILAVGKGSARPPRLVTMRWRGGDPAQRPVALVGKGITFDTGGISLKAGKDMDMMKFDMAGAAAVVGTLKVAALRKLPLNVVGVVALAENMPSAGAYRPGDIVRTLSGKTVEVLNTDAEGRLVLADALTHVQASDDPAIIIDLATLTMAAMVALGFEYCASFTDSARLWADLESASSASGEKLWRMPLDSVWNKEMKSTIADLKNLATVGTYGGCCTAAAFLQEFVDTSRRSWAHLDVAGTAWQHADGALAPKGGTGFGVRVLSAFLAHHAQDPAEFL